ncbi:CBS domain-containing protein [Paraburkholderia sp. RP-4-7]|jgi:CBS domain-containing protein|uniref:CBS domain-containing protein n=1 Tax=Paraburkholderia polaris TaxID=2728848 RepID=A0A848I8X2_9BURK|nr:CBS domain-containing protein [Paraburkholderia polaris]NML97869.1 CBS domain-containing protein [Paraburkholderia polaris]
MLVKDMMKEPVRVQAEETLDTAARKLKNENIGALPVCQDTRVIGMLTDRDITMRGVADARNVSQMTVREAMSAEVLFCFDDDPIEHAATIMNQNHVHRLAVLDRGNRHLVGVISLSDVGGGTSQRRPYEVIFHKTFTDHSGHPHHSELMRISVAQGTKAEAISTAICQFEQLNKVTVWHQLADGYDVTSVRVDAEGATVEEREPTSEREARILRRAREVWERAGTPEGRDVQFWEQAAGEIDREDHPRE